MNDLTCYLAFGHGFEPSVLSCGRVVCWFLGDLLIRNRGSTLPVIHPLI